MRINSPDDIKIKNMPITFQIILTIILSCFLGYFLIMLLTFIFLGIEKSIKFLKDNFFYILIGVILLLLILKFLRKKKVEVSYAGSN